MTILQPGNIDWYKDRHPYQFHCDICGCIWVGFYEEYDVLWDQREDNVIMSMKCPTCGKSTHGEKYEEHMK